MTPLRMSVVSIHMHVRERRMEGGALGFWVPMGRIIADRAVWQLAQFWPPFKPRVISPPKKSFSGLILGLEGAERVKLAAVVPVIILRGSQLILSLGSLLNRPRDQETEIHKVGLLLSSVIHVGPYTSSSSM